MKLVKVTLLMLSGLLVGVSQATDLIRVGVLKFGTVNWELNTVHYHKLDRKHGFVLEIVSFPSNQAAKIAFHGRQVDIIVGDWVWVSRERHRGENFSFIPYSGALGAVMVPATSAARNILSLRDQRVGVAGGAYDKSWLLLRAWAKKRHGFDPAAAFDVQYAAPPLLNGQIEHGHLDAVLNYWHYCARLEALGYRQIVEMRDIVREFTQSETLLPMVGYIFRTDWGARGNQVQRFNTAVLKARQLLFEQDAEWERLRPMMQIKNAASFNTLKRRYRAGIPQRWDEAERIGAAKLFEVVAALAGKTLPDSQRQIADGTFWDSVRF